MVNTPSSSKPCHDTRIEGGSVRTELFDGGGRSMLTVGAFENEKKARNTRGPIAPSLSTAAITKTWKPRSTVSESLVGDCFGAENTSRFSLSVVTIQVVSASSGGSTAYR